MRAQSLLDDLLSQTRRCGIETRYTPAVRVADLPGTISFQWRTGDDGFIALTRWPALPPMLQQVLAQWAAAGSLGLTPQGQFEEVFHSLLLPHEYAHFLQQMSGRLPRLDRYTSELEANSVAIAYWSIEPGEKARLPARIENFTRFLQTLPDPVPPGQDRRAWFNANYDALENDQLAYAWFQGALMQEAWTQQKSRDFCAQARAATAVP